MMTENNNLLYHTGDGGFDRLEDMEGGGTLARIPVLRSVPSPMPRPWATRGAISLLVVCGVVLGIIAIATMNNGSASAATAETASDPTSATAEGETIVGGSSSFAADNDISGSISAADNGLSGSTSTAESTFGSSSTDKSESSSNDSFNDTSNESSSGISAVLAGVHPEGSTSGSNSSRDASSFEEVMIDLRDISTGHSQIGSFEGSESDVSESESQGDSAGGEQDFLVSSSDSIDGSSEWLFDSVSGSHDLLMEDSASHSWSMDDETSDSLSRSEDSSLEF